MIAINTTDIFPPLVMDEKLQITNGEHVQNICEVRISKHSTPIRKKNLDNDMENPELEYHCSPILIPLTQDTGNEVVWDWQSSSSRTTLEDKINYDRAATPKRTKLLQKKRNSNSPLLHKPLKRKLVRLKNMESIGKFAAELQALTEKMRDIKRNDDNDVVSEETYAENGITISLAIGSINENRNELKICDNKNAKSYIEKARLTDKIKSSYEELFDDSIDDSMIRCSQEVEEKLNLVNEKKSCLTDLCPTSEEKERNSLDEKSAQHLASNSSEKLKPSYGLSHSSFSFNTSNSSKTYSKMSNTTNQSSKDESLKRICANNLFDARVEVPRFKRTLLDGNNVDLFEIPDDSFDDCLATCMEDGELLSKSEEYDNLFSDTNDNMLCNSKSYKMPNSHLFSNKKSSTESKTVSSCKTNIGGLQNNNNKFENGDQKQRTNTNVKNMVNMKVPRTTAIMENRKFFKTKSLSDSCFGQERGTNVQNKVNGAIYSRYIAKSSSNSNLLSKNCNEMHSNSLRSAVSTLLSQTQNACDGKGSIETCDMDNILTLNVNRFDVKEGGNNVIRYSSLNNLNSIANEAKRNFHSGQCTAEEIEKKRLEAMMRLQAKRKSQLHIGPITLAETLAKKSVKR